ncbi:MAG: di-trans,poly-cis-decaprenylcistransferase [Solirubrobacterales bacterium]|nr:di-trans,poly-cis-decaprenylcistransferase [Solirubrobacterales bacterium]
MPADDAHASATCVAIIMDGNGRWADEHGMPTLEGHREGARTLKQIVKDSVAIGIEELTVYAFSTENWSRPEDEVSGLMEMFAELIVSETPELDEQGVRMRFVGRRKGVSERLRRQMEWAEAETADNERMILFVAFNYGGRAEILDAAEGYEGGGEAAFSALLYAPEMRDPELVIRTSGEERLSNFLLWQSAYAELVFSDCLWPDFDRGALENALQQYASRRRRFGARG